MGKNAIKTKPPGTAVYIRQLESVIMEQQKQIEAMNEKLDHMNGQLLTVDTTISEQAATINALNEKLDSMNEFLRSVQHMRFEQFGSPRVQSTEKPTEISETHPAKRIHTIRDSRSRAADRLSKLLTRIGGGIKSCGKKVSDSMKSFAKRVKMTLSGAFQTIINCLKICGKRISVLWQFRSYGKRAVKKLLKLLRNVVCLCTKNVNYTSELNLEKHISIRTQRKGTIAFLGYAVVRSYCELHADGGKIYIGDQCFLNRNCMVVSQSRIDIGDNTTIGPNVIIYDHDHDYMEGSGTVCSDVRIGKNVWIGANATILRGSVIGDNCVVGAGALVKGIIDANTMVYSLNELKHIDLLRKQMI